MILLAAEGVSNNGIAQQTSLSRPTVIATWTAFARGGVEAIGQRQKRQRSRRVLTPELERKILDTTLQTKPPDATHWSVRTLARHLGVTRTLLHGVWQRYDMQPHRVERFKLSNDPKFEEKVRDVVGVYLNPPERALVLCVDEKSQIQALDRTAPLLPLRSAAEHSFALQNSNKPSTSGWLTGTRNPNRSSGKPLPTGSWTKYADAGRLL